MEAFVIDDEELGKDYSGLCLQRATAMATQACHGGHGLRLVSAGGMLGHVADLHFPSMCAMLLTASEGERHGTHACTLSPLS
jgi:hypothetical protein